MYPLRTWPLTKDKAFRDRVFKLDEAHHKKVETLCIWGEYFIKHAANNDRSKATQLIVVGPTGCGKTTVTSKVVRYFNDYGVDFWRSGKWPSGKVPYARFIDWSDVSTQEKEEAFGYAMEWINGAALVVLDDVGAEAGRFKNQVSEERFRKVLNATENKYLIVTTNVPKSQWTERWDTRVSDRLNAMAHLDMTGVPSYREKKAKK